MPSYRVSLEEQGSSLLTFLKLKGPEGTSLNELKKIIEAKGCKVGGRVECFTSRRLVEGEVVEIDFCIKPLIASPPKILFEDRDFLIIDKPAGLISTNNMFPETYLVHRLDKETSGVLLLAKNPEAEELAKTLFSTRTICKEYLALVEGKVSSPRGVIDNFLGKKGSYEGQTLYGSTSPEKGLKAITQWHLLENSKGASLLLCNLKTGRTHQIRVHLSELGHPILGDHQYVKKAFKISYQPKRHLLHAFRLSFTHPKTHKLIQVVAPLPLDFEQALKALAFSFQGL